MKRDGTLKKRLLLIRKYNGSSLAQYVIIIVLVILAVGFAFSLTGSNLVSIFSKYLTTFQEMGETAQSNAGNSGPSAIEQAIVNGTIENGGLGGSIDSPKSQCVTNICAIDYGDFILNGLPEDYGEIVETVGAAGGTEQLLAILDKLAAEASSLDPPIDTSLIKELSTLGHELAAGMKDVEDVSPMFADVTDLATLESVFDQYQTAHFGLAAVYPFQDKLAEVNAMYANPVNTYEETVVEIVNALAEEIIYTKDDLSGSTIKLFIESKKQLGHYGIGTFDESKIDSLLESDIENHVYSKETNMNAAVICATGHGADNGMTCN